MVDRAVVGNPRRWDRSRSAVPLLEESLKSLDLAAVDYGTCLASSLSRPRVARRGDLAAAAST